MIAFDAVEQGDAEALDLIAANAGGYRRPGGVKIGIEEAIGKVPHREPRGLAMHELNRMTARYHDRGVELMRAAAQASKLVACCAQICRLAEEGRSKCQGLVGTEHRSEERRV